MNEFTFEPAPQEPKVPDVIRNNRSTSKPLDRYDLATLKDFIIAKQEFEKELIAWREAFDNWQNEYDQAHEDWLAELWEKQYKIHKVNPDHPLVKWAKIKAEDDQENYNPQYNNLEDAFKAYLEPYRIAKKYYGDK